MAIKAINTRLITVFALLLTLVCAAGETRPGDGKTPPVKPPDKTTDKSSGKSPGESDEMTLEDFKARFMRRDIQPRPPAEMKKFLDRRLDDLKKIVGGNWRLIETPHFYCFSNLPEIKHKEVAYVWNEGFYKLLAGVLQHKETDKLWNNKCPIYYFENFAQFQKFAVHIDHAPGAANSGGYFSANGREVHICIPFMSQQKGPKAADRMARSTLCHEGTHAFLQLTGEDVELTRWLHEGLAQFMEFWYDPENNPERADRVQLLKYMQAEKRMPSWGETKMRPMSGTDSMGYACAWAKLEFFYRNFDKSNLPKMIRLIKTGKTEEQAMEEVFKIKPDKLESGYNIWLKDTLSRGFKFPNTGGY